jgi:hypothetical protein
MEQIQRELDLSAVPAFTTLQKFLLRIKTFSLRITLGERLNQVYSGD